MCVCVVCTKSGYFFTFALKTYSKVNCIVHHGIQSAMGVQSIASVRKKEYDYCVKLEGKVDTSI